jgi:RNA polymerase sigma factor for flagellar operon FliA
MTRDLSDRERIERLIEQGQPLVISLASRIRRNVPVRIDMDDLIAYGEIGLAESARDFDPTKGASFTTYAYYRVRGAIYDGVSKMSWSSRARYRRHRFNQLSSEYLACQSQESADQGASTLEGDAKWFRDTTDKLAIIFFGSIDQREGDSFSASLEDHAMLAAPSIVAQREIVKNLHAMVDTLPSIEEKLIRHVYFDGATLQEAGDSLGISKSWASRLHARALEHLASSLRKMEVRS